MWPQLYAAADAEAWRRLAFRSSTKGNAKDAAKAGEVSPRLTLVVLPAVLATVGPPIHLGSLTLTGDVLCRRKVTQKM